MQEDLSWRKHESEARGIEVVGNLVVPEGAGPGAVYEGVLVGPGAEPHPGFEEEANADREDLEAYPENKYEETLGFVDSWDYEEYHKLVITCAGRFFAKVSVLPDPETRSVRCMYLYCAGWRRRAKLRAPFGPYSAEIVWHFAAILARKYYGLTGRVFIMLPQISVVKPMLRHSPVLYKTPQTGYSGDLICTEINEAIGVGTLSTPPEVWWSSAVELSVGSLLSLKASHSLLRVYFGPTVADKELISSEVTSWLKVESRLRSGELVLPWLRLISKSGVYATESGNQFAFNWEMCSGEMTIRLIAGDEKELNWTDQAAEFKRSFMELLASEGLLYWKAEVRIERLWGHFGLW